MMKFLNLIALLSFICLMACQNEQIRTGNPLPVTAGHKAEVKEVIQTTSYTYLRVLKNNQYQWIAINKQDIQAGSIIYYEGGLKMEKFTSPELKRTFEEVYFVQNISDKPITPETPAMISGSEPKKPVLTKQELKIDQPEGTVTISELYARRDSYSGKTVKVRGKVTKVNLAIMNRNWVHIQDGTADGEYFDLTITTNHQPREGDIVTYTGILTIDKDFGSGYSYSLILENAEPFDSLR
ncbi:MAG: hypothetical protein FJY07_05825 [Bacteroidetes bacterium]|nr:hypothetical protein [Bacteroidota bacterium]